jgi:peptide/nickel transport system permease protein
MRFKLGISIVSLFFIVGIFAPWIAPFFPDQDRLLSSFADPSSAHLLGLDQNGRDLLSVVIMGARTSLIVGVCTALLSASFGLLVGVMAGWSRGWADKVFLFVMDLVLAFPGMILALALAFILGPGLMNVIIAMTATGWVAYARVVRSEVLQLREMDFVMAGISIGASKYNIILKYLIPNLISILVIQMTFGIAGAIIVEGTLSFLGVGTPIDQASWGNMLNQGREYILSHPRLCLVPGFTLMVVIMSFNFLGDSLRDYLDPKRVRT